MKKRSMLMRRIRWVELRLAFISVCATVAAGLLLIEPIPAAGLAPSSSLAPATMPRVSSIYTKMVLAMRRESPPSTLPVQLTHACAVHALPPHHGDLFDRMLIAQAILEGLTIVTADPLFARYNVALLPA